MELEALKSKVTPQAGKKINVPCSMTADDDGNIVLTIPQRIPVAACKDSSTGKSIVVTFVPQLATGGRATLPVVVFDESGGEEVLSLAISVINGSIKA